MTLSVNEPYCPIVKMEVFEDAAFTIPWTNTSQIALYNGDIPSMAYLSVTTYEVNRTTWLRDIYIKATTVGGATN
jgi:hypothetical protein